MSFAKSYYAQDAENKSDNFASNAGMPSNAHVEQQLSPTQLQEAIRLYRSVISNSAPQSPVTPRHHAQQAHQEIQSNYYGGGPVDVPQSYMVNYSNKLTRADDPKFQMTEAVELAERVKALNITHQEPVQEACVQEAPAPRRLKPVNQEEKVTRRMYDDDESGYCYNQEKDDEETVVDDAALNDLKATPYIGAEATEATVVSYQPPVNQQYNTAPSEYIGMSNENRFIYDGQRQNKAYNNPPHTVINNSQPQQYEEETAVPSMCDDTTQRPVDSPVAGQSRFRTLINRPSNFEYDEQTAPIVVERIEPQESPRSYEAAYDAFNPVGQIVTESEYQLPLLNDLASCIENY